MTHKEWVQRTFEGEKWKQGWDDAAAGLIVTFFIAMFIWIRWL